MRLIKLKTNRDSRGCLTAVEAAVDVPFEIQRCYLLHDLNAPRGGHAHRDTQQLVIAASGTVNIRLFDGTTSRSFILNEPTSGLLINPMTWIEIPEFSMGAVVVVLASTHYKPERTLRDWDLFLNEMNTKQGRDEKSI